ncbi:MAG: hypothetical protein AAGF28_05620 [Pseudomonadota bacterium]
MFSRSFILAALLALPVLASNFGAFGPAAHAQAPSSTGISPKTFLFIRKDNNQSRRYNLQWLFEREIYGTHQVGNSSVRIRVLALLTPYLISSGPNRPYVIAYEGGNTNNRPTGYGGDLVITSNFTLEKTDMPLDTVYGSTVDGEGIAARQTHPATGTEHNNHNIYWLRDVSSSKIVAEEKGSGSNRLYRVLSFMIPAFVKIPGNYPDRFPMSVYGWTHAATGGSAPAIRRLSVYDAGFKTR